MPAKLKLTGDVALRNNMRRLARVYDGRSMDADIEASLEPLRRETEQNAASLRNYVGKWPDFFPQPTKAPKGGHLDQGVESARISGSSRKRVWWVGFSKRARKLAHLLEFGVAPHFQPRFKRGWMHPGSRPYPFFRPAFDSKKGVVLDTLRRRAWQRIASVAIRMKSK